MVITVPNWQVEHIHGNRVCVQCGAAWVNKSAKYAFAFIFATGCIGISRIWGSECVNIFYLLLRELLLLHILANPRKYVLSILHHQICGHSCVPRLLFVLLMLNVVWIRGLKVPPEQKCRRADRRVREHKTGLKSPKQG